MSITSDRMRCKHCAYRLDGLADNRCPECGAAFDPDDPDSFNDDSPPPPLIGTQRCLVKVARICFWVWLVTFLIGAVFPGHRDDQPFRIAVQISRAFVCPGILGMWIYMVAAVRTERRHPD